MKVRQPRGFTLIEVLVVIAIVGLLIAMLLPAVQKVREASSRMKCLNNLKQVALAFENYENAHNHYPLETAKSSFWTTILPYVEQGNLLDLYKGQEATNKNVAYPHWDSYESPRLRIAECPSTPPTTAYNEYGANADHVARRKPSAGFHGTTDYQRLTEVYAVGQFNNGNPVGTSSSVWDPMPDDKRTLMFYTSKFLRKRASVKDGFSSTIFLVEMAGVPDGYLNGIKQTVSTSGVMANPAMAQQAPWAGEKGYARIYGTDPTKKLQGDPDLVKTCAMNCSNYFEVYSFHRGGCNFPFLDGSVRFLRQDIDVALLAALGTCKAGEATGGGE